MSLVKREQLTYRCVENLQSCAKDNLVNSLIKRRKKIQIAGKFQKQQLKQSLTMLKKFNFNSEYDM